jgi:hypothetical protein
MKKIHVYLSFAMLVSLAACKKEPATPPANNTSGSFENGVFIVNEGISSSTSSVDFYSRAENTVSNNVYQHGGNIGTPLQSMAFSGSEVFFVVSGAGTIYVADATDLTKKDSITGFSFPRYILPVNDSIAYVTDWYTDQSIAVVNTNTRSIITKIPNGDIGPDRLAMVQGKIFVVNQGIYDFSSSSFKPDSSVTVIDPVTHTITASLKIGAVPSSLQADKNGNLWVLCSGNADYMTPSNGTPAQLYKIDPVNLLVLASFQVSGNEDHPVQLAIDRTKSILAYFYGDKIFKYHVDSLALPAGPFIQGGNYYSIGIDTEADVLYVTDPKNFTQNGTVLRYDLSNGSLIGSFEAGIVPGNIYFR